MTPLDPDDRAGLDSTRGTVPALACAADPRDEDIATPAEQDHNECDGQRDGGNDEDRVRVLSGSEDSDAGQSFADMLVLETDADYERFAK